MIFLISELEVESTRHAKDRRLLASVCRKLCPTFGQGNRKVALRHLTRQLKSHYPIRKVMLLGDLENAKERKLNVRVLPVPS
jgi:hypothetical protein